mmetsp:Transcript_11732/g.37584  ORF Transcript_11732/g.37584 Transcript_11732/m.37584 type:complete len:1045 (+) Transcript_11732:3-3137(+)
MTQLLTTLEQDPVKPVKRNAGQVVAAVANAMASDVSGLMREWPSLLPALSRFIGSGNSGSRVVALEVLKDLVPNFGDGLMAQGEQVIGMLSTTLSDSEAEVRAASAELVLQLVEDLEPEEVEPIKQVMPAIVPVLKNFASEGKEEPLKDSLQALVSAADAEPEFFKDTCMEALWPLLLEMCAAGSAAFADPEVRHVAMEAAMSLAVGLHEDFSKPEGPGQAMLERLISLNVEWMLEVEEDVEAWTTQGKEENEDECDDDVVEYGEQNLDRLAEKFDEDIFMPMLFKLLRAAGLAPSADWKHARASVSAVSQVVEHILEDPWVDQCVDFIAQNLAHAHPRVRFAAFTAVGQVAYDQAPHVQETHHALLLPPIAAGIKDTNIRVATEAVSAFTSLASDLDCDDLEPFMEDLLTAMFARLGQGESRAMQENCLTGIASVAEVMEELFLPYYSTVVPALKQIIANATGEKDRSLRGKAFECVSLVGSVVGKETFAEDAHEVMKIMAQMVQSGFAADDPQQESVREASGKIAHTLGKDFKLYVPALLPVLFETLKNRPSEVDPADMPDDDDSDDETPDMSLSMVNGKVLGMKTSVLDEMADCLDLIKVFIDSLEEEFCEFLPPTCQNMLPLLDIQLSENLQEKAFKTWEALVQCARRGVEHGRLEGGNLQELVTVFLEKVVGALRDACQNKEPDNEVIDVLQAKVVGVSGVIRKAGAGILTADGVGNIAGIVVQLISIVQASKDQDNSADDAMVHRKGRTNSDDSDSDDDTLGIKATPQTVCFALADVAGALMRTCPDEFAEVALQTYMQFVQKLLQEEASDGSRSLAFYITDDVVDCLGLKSVPYWNGFMTLALQGMGDKSATVRQYASSTIGNGARHPIFEQMAPAAASQIHRMLQKQGERHRRRKAVKADAKQAALAVDAGIRALGEICEHHEAKLGDHAGTVWSMWLSNLPLRYDEEAGQQAHALLLRMVSRGHPLVTSAQHLTQVVTVFAEVYKTKFSNSDLDKDISTALASIGEEPLKQVCSGLQEKHQRKVEHILQGAKAGA